MPSAVPVPCQVEPCVLMTCAHGRLLACPQPPNVPKVSGHRAMLALPTITGMARSMKSSHLHDKAPIRLHRLHFRRLRITTQKNIPCLVSGPIEEISCDVASLLDALPPVRRDSNSSWRRFDFMDFEQPIFRDIRRRIRVSGRRMCNLFFSGLEHTSHVAVNIHKNHLMPPPPCIGTCCRSYREYPTSRPAGHLFQLLAFEPQVQFEGTFRKE